MLQKTPVSLLKDDVAYNEVLDEGGRILMAAADYLEKYGWKRGGLGNLGKEVCALGAISAATNNIDSHSKYLLYTDRKCPGRIKLEQYLLVQYGSSHIAHFNDLPNSTGKFRTKNEIVAVMRAAALS
jgi:hypothetical protein